jgi:septal ring factor EnvC (AmiA/AmiB activator)
MKRFSIIFFLAALTLSSVAQNKTSRSKKQATTTVVNKRSTKNSNKNTTKKSSKKLSGKTRNNSSQDAYANTSIRGLQNERSKIQKKIKIQERALRENKADVKKRLDNLLVLNSQIDEKKKNIDGIQQDISNIEGNIGILNVQLSTLEKELNERKVNYIKSMRYMARHKTAQDNIMFIFSAKSFAQMYRRLRFMREYASFQKAQGEAVMLKQEQVTGKHQQLQSAKWQKHTLLNKGQQEKQALESKQNEQQTMVSSLQKQQKTIQKIIAEQRQKDAALNSKIDQLVAQEVAKARARAAAETKRKAAAAAEAKRKADELVRQKALAEAAAKENERRIAEAKEREAKMKAEAAAAAKAEDSARKARTEQAAREAIADRMAAERKAKADEARSRQSIAQAKESSDRAEKMTASDRMMSGGFEANRGRLPMPITGNYRIVSHFGQYNVEGLKNVTLDNKGINILGGSGCQARSIYDGEVSAVFGIGGTMVVMVRHGAYISVYCNLRSVNVSTGQHVSTRQALGTVGVDNILQFQLRRETSKLNPEAWLAR